MAAPRIVRPPGRRALCGSLRIFSISFKKCKSQVYYGENFKWVSVLSPCLNRPEFYAALAKAFLLDKDGPGPEEKLLRYYEHVVG